MKAVQMDNSQAQYSLTNKAKLTKKQTDFLNKMKERINIDVKIKHHLTENQEIVFDTNLRYEDSFESDDAESFNSWTS